MQQLSVPSTSYNLHCVVTSPALTPSHPALYYITEFIRVPQSCWHRSFQKATLMAFYTFRGTKIVQIPLVVTC